MGAVVMAGQSPPAPTTAPAASVAPGVAATEPAKADAPKAEPAATGPATAEPVKPDPAEPDSGAGGAAADGEFIEFLGADDTDDSAWWEFLNYGEAHQGQSRAQDSRQ